MDQLLTRVGHSTLCLRHKATVSHARYTKEVLKPLWPRYLFAQAPVWEISRTIGVTTVLSFGDGPAEVPQAVIDEQRARGDENGLVSLTPEQKKARQRYRNGERVRIDDGPFSGLFGEIALDNGKEIQVWLDEFRARGVTIFKQESVSPIVAER